MGYRYQFNLTTLKTTHTDDKIKMPISRYIGVVRL